jgi:hypothetical protein
LGKNGSLRVSGLAWQKGENHEALPPSAYAANILCDRHNTALSPLDGTALRLFHALDHSADLKGETNSERIFLFSGHDVERWLLKMLCGALFSKSVILRNGIDTQLPERWLQILFGRDNFADGEGLYLYREPGRLFRGRTGVQMRVVARDKKPVGIYVAVSSYEFILLMQTPPSRTWNGAALCYRPLELYTPGPGCERSIVFSWAGAADFGTIRARVWPS